MATNSELPDEKHAIESNLNGIHNRLKSFITDQIQIVDDIVTIIEAFCKTEKYAIQKMGTTLEKTVGNVQQMSCLGTSSIGNCWTLALKEIEEHFLQREATLPILKQLIIENLKKLKNEKIDELNRFVLFGEEISKEIVEIERRTVKSKRNFQESFERFKQKIAGSKEKRTKIEKLHKKKISQNEIQRAETDLVEARNLYIFQVHQMNHALKLYSERFIDDFDKLIVCDMFQSIENILADMAFKEYSVLRESIQRAMKFANENCDQKKRQLLPNEPQIYPLIIGDDQNEKIVVEAENQTQFSSIYSNLVDEAQETKELIRSTLENASQNVSTARENPKFRLKRFEFKESVLTFSIEFLESIFPKIKNNSNEQIPKSNFKLITKKNLKVRFINEKIVEPKKVDSIVENLVEAVVLYDFLSTSSNELSVEQNQSVLVDLKLAKEAWIFVRAGEKFGFVPESYVKIISTEKIEPSDEKIVINDEILPDDFSDDSS